MNRSKVTVRVDAISKYVGFDKNCVALISNVTCDFTSDKTYALCGMSGSGKSTLLHIIAGLDQPTQGSVLYNGRTIASFTPREKEQFFNQTIGMVFQLPYLIRELSVLENVMLPGVIAGHNEDRCADRAAELLHAVMLDHKAFHKPGALSVGQQQRVALARALFNKPYFLIADEPTGSLDSTTGRVLIDLMQQYHTTWGMGLIISTHDEYVASRMDRSYILNDGSLSTR